MQLSEINKYKRENAQNSSDKYSYSGATQWKLTQPNQNEEDKYWGK